MGIRATACSSFLVILMFVTGCAVESDAPPRPANLPKEAFWLGGADGGAFVRLARAEAADGYVGAVYREDGSIWYEGRFVLDPPNAAPVDPDDHADFTGWDGTQLLLREGRALVAKDAR